MKARGFQAFGHEQKRPVGGSDNLLRIKATSVDVDDAHDRLHREVPKQRMRTSRRCRCTVEARMQCVGLDLPHMQLW